ncbi:MAG TPA: NADP-dependent oxidoreductase [Acidobacteriaceae bacterium]|jgi:NADPH:quinone reductase-like Zn-dependent oxidoreductase|nr:NADP-dependent oxidoreductase [Acidobacteriaceae bacterium]
MKAIRIHQYGGPEVLTLDETPRPEPGPGQVLVRVHAAGVNPADWKVRAGYFKEFLPLQLPAILGFDLAGEVEAAGPGVAGFSKGVQVYGTAMGTYAEYVAANVAEIAPRPRSLDYVRSASIPVSAQTAWQALFDAGGLKAGQTVLIHGATGGVGSFAVQLAKAKGAHVLGTASARNQAYLRELGADEPIDYETTKFESVAHDVDVVFDTQGGATQQRSWPVLKRGGVLVSIAQPPSQEEAAKYGVRGVYLGQKASVEQLVEIAGMVDAGKLKTTVEVVLPLAEARRAQELSESGHTRGKIVLTCD